MTSHWLSFYVVVGLAFLKSVIIFFSHELAGQAYTTKDRNMPVGTDVAMTHVVG
jgi:hypothetical protein